MQRTGSSFTNRPAWDAPSLARVVFSKESEVVVFDSAAGKGVSFPSIHPTRTAPESPGRGSRDEEVEPSKEGAMRLSFEAAVMLASLSLFFSCKSQSKDTLSEYATQAVKDGHKVEDLPTSPPPRQTSARLCV